MKRLAVILAALGAVCWWRSRHDPARHPLGGYKCRDCKRASADMEGQGYGDQYVRETRHFSRANGGEFVRGHWWRPRA